MKQKKLIYICSPLKGNIKENIKKAKKYCKEVILEENIPIAPHIYFTSFLNDNNDIERKIGLECGIELLKICQKIYVYGDIISQGMKLEIEWWKNNKNEDDIIYKKMKGEE